ncbi:MAG: hypothetical protein II180_12880 [Proteobacteria bacterium]|nr:hypothetical protein [Pseudomonadota bacterium]
MHIPKSLILILSLCLVAICALGCAHSPEPDTPATAADTQVSPSEDTPEAETPAPEVPTISPEEQARYDEAAEAAFHAVDSRYQSFIGTEIVLDNSGKELQRVSERLSELVPYYANIIKDGHSPRWSIASFYNVGTLYQHIYNSLMNTPTPEGLAEAVAQAYRELIIEYADKFKQPAIEHYMRAVKISDSEKINTDYSENARIRLNDLNK